MNVKYMKICAVALVCLMVACVACSKKAEFSVDGTIAGADGDTVRLERMNATAGWVTVAEAVTGSDGAFSLSSDAPECPELYRIALRGKYVYLPVDSTESFTLTAKAADIANGFKLGGSHQAEQMTAFEAQARRVEAYHNADSTENFKRRVFDKYLKNARANIFSYYVLTRPFGDGYLIEYTDPLYRAVATAFQTFRPDDPHTPLLAERARQGLAEANRNKGKERVFEARETAVLDITLNDVNGRPVALSSLLGKGKPVILAFGGMTIPDAPQINMALRKLYDAGKADIYQVCIDDDRFLWAQAAKALPWTVVIDPDGVHSKAAALYNLASVPAYFIYNTAGELVSSTPEVTQVPGLL